LPASFSFRSPLRNIFRARRRSIYTIIGITFALILTISTWALFDSFDYLIDRKFNFDENWDVAAVLAQPIDLAQFGDIQRWPGVRRVQPAGQVTAKLEADGKTHEGLLIAMDPAADFRRFDIASGDTARDALDANGLILPQTIADKLDVEVGDEVLVKTPYSRESRPVTLRSIADEAWGASMFTSARQGMSLVGSPVPVPNALYIEVEPGSAGEVKKRLYGVPGTESVVVKDDLKSAIVDQLDFLYLFGGILLAFGFSMAFVVIYNTFTANITERTREIATMRTIGEDGRHLAWMVTLENMLLAVVGIPLGIVLGLYAANSLYASLSTEAYTFRAVLYPQTYLWIILSILGVLLVSEIPPILRIFRLDLAEATKVIE
jgi:putative ABC transport system permease protein